MKKMNTFVKWAAAITAVAGIAYLVVRYFDAIHAWLCKLCPFCTLEDDFVVDEEFAPFTEEHAEEPCCEAQETPCADEQVAEDHKQAAEENENAAEEPHNTPVANEEDFEEQ